jgi:hypothetical protein
MFQTKNHLIAIIVLFYRVTLLNFAKEAAAVSRELFPVFSGQMVRLTHMQYATRVIADYSYFHNCWLFSEITTKDEGLTRVSAPFGAEGKVCRCGPQSVHRSRP